MNQIPVTRSMLPPLQEYVNEIRDLWETHWLTNMGSHHEELRESLREYLQTENLTLLVNGHSALELSIQALHLTGEVITTPFTFASTTHAIVRSGLEPVFCDIRADDHTIDPEKIEALITPRTSAILPVHVYGNICDIDSISQIAEKHHLKVIYDAAHAFGERYRGKGIADFGDVSIFSFHATKVFHTIEGGAAAYHDSDFEIEMKKLFNFGIKNEEVVDGIGCNAKMNEFAAAMGICNLRHIDDEIRKRKAAAMIYQECLSDIRGIRLPDYSKTECPNYGYFPIVIEENLFGQTRDTLYNRMKEQNIHARKYFYPLTSMFLCYAGRYDVGATPVAKKTAEQVLCLPLYAELTEDDLMRTVRIITEGRQDRYV